MLSNNSYLRGIKSIVKNEFICDLRYSNYIDTGCDHFLTTKEYVDKKINDIIDIGVAHTIDGELSVIINPDEAINFSKTLCNGIYSRDCYESILALKITKSGDVTVEDFGEYDYIIQFNDDAVVSLFYKSSSGPLKITNPSYFEKYIVVDSISSYSLYYFNNNSIVPYNPNIKLLTNNSIISLFNFINDTDNYSSYVSIISDKNLSFVDPYTFLIHTNDGVYTELCSIDLQNVGDKIAANYYKNNIYDSYVFNILNITDKCNKLCYMFISNKSSINDNGRLPSDNTVPVSRICFPINNYVLFKDYNETYKISNGLLYIRNVIDYNNDNHIEYDDEDIDEMKNWYYLYLVKFDDTKSEINLLHNSLIYTFYNKSIYTFPNCDYQIYNEHVDNDEHPDGNVLDYPIYSDLFISNPEIGQICLFTYEYEPNKIDVLRIFNNNWDDLTKSGSFTLKKDNIDYFVVDYTYDKYSSKFVSLSVNPTVNSIISSNSYPIIELSCDDDTIVVPNNISSIFSYRCYSGFNCKSNNITYNSFELHVDTSIEPTIGGDNIAYTYSYSDGRSIKITGTIVNNIFIPTSYPTAVSGYFTNNTNNNNIVLFHSLDVSGSVPVETNIMYPFLLFGTVYGSNLYIYSLIEPSSYCNYFFSDYSLLSKLTISPITSGSSTVNKYSIHLLSSPEGPFNYFPLLSTNGSPSSDPNIWISIRPFNISYIKN